MFNILNDTLHTASRQDPWPVHRRPARPSPQRRTWLRRALDLYRG
ncbi:hypothetical protein OG2516_11611 [Oceanicola granulosus HTCC2516]|uniref:Uncharacterized protein n=1 Tax=Oceanicola granulosus (strain ATCC BAA-861 / DSM 15982 / KCTC 12143 / HTCC2516) TaxID=314256 RepID=Q2CJN1_OCEGH|nr:hypothetical protein [Oceanicola granulosus]EAR53108.1 hypothetical protein OG2516_11611 [Oceanicola granulosus HTCC2516]